MLAPLFIVAKAVHLTAVSAPVFAPLFSAVFSMLFERAALSRRGALTLWNLAPHLEGPRREKTCKVADDCGVIIGPRSGNTAKPRFVDSIEDFRLYLEEYEGNRELFLEKRVSFRNMWGRVFIGYRIDDLEFSYVIRSTIANFCATC